jgi:hypothetical protein
MEQVLAHIIWLLIQCLYYESGTSSYTMLGCDALTRLSLFRYWQAS